ncbi:MAG: glycine zipper 2TM domain-containing protein [Sphingobacteriales bacterium]|nr:glycine zipper 2TM domain-containing protein [Sphingobacteriales bacterium]MBI3718092.1 glycine zipper 2TM domain-containing protein [Sphingobacteriales bacterium]
MKKILSVIGIVLVSAVVFTACKSSTDNKEADQTKILSASDAAQYQEFQQFQDWKKQQDMQNDRMAGTTASNTGATRVVYRTKPVYRTSAPTTSTTTTRKKGWSKAAKGTVIGAAGGAIAGAVINKRNRAVGAVIGGIIGGGVGYGIGRSMDKKDGRIN